jgi:hypothetical protein
MTQAASVSIQSCPKKMRATTMRMRRVAVRIRFMSLKQNTWRRVEIGPVEAG